jgi:hypothetical protein
MLSGLTAGSQVVTEEFIRDFQRRLEDAKFEITPQLYYKARKAFNERKLSVGEELPEPRWSIEMIGLARDDNRNFAEGRMWFTGYNYFASMVCLGG